MERTNNLEEQKLLPRIIGNSLCDITKNENILLIDCAGVKG
jgi:hypothetical protein